MSCPVRTVLSTPPSSTAASRITPPELPSRDIASARAVCVCVCVCVCGCVGVWVCYGRKFSQTATKFAKVLSSPLYGKPTKSLVTISDKV